MNLTDQNQYFVVFLKIIRILYTQVQITWFAIQLKFRAHKNVGL